MINLSPSAPLALNSKPEFADAGFAPVRLLGMGVPWENRCLRKLGRVWGFGVLGSYVLMQDVLENLSSILFGGYYGTQYRVRLCPPFGVYPNALSDVQVKCPDFHTKVWGQNPLDEGSGTIHYWTEGPRGPKPRND